MSIRWMAVQYVGDTLRIPIVSEDDMDKPFGSSVLEREVKRIVVNPFSDSSQAFVPEEEVAKLRELVHDMGFLIAWADWDTVEDDERAYQLLCRAEETGIEVCQ